MLEIRPARAEDKDAVLAFCQQTFAWGDYIHHVYDDWVADANGDMTVATVDGVPVALSRVRYVGPTEAWFEGLRVNPAHRRHGLGKAIAEYNQERARQRGILVGRAFISGSNTASQTLSSQMGFVRVAEYRGWDVQSPVARPTAPFLVQQATAADLPKVIDFMKNYRHKLISWHWHAQQVSEHALQRAIDDQALWLAWSDGAVMAASTVTFWDGDKEMDIVSLFSAQPPPAVAIVQHMINMHLDGQISELRIYQHHEQPALDLAVLGFAADPDEVSGIWELKLMGE